MLVRRAARGGRGGEGSGEEGGGGARGLVRGAAWGGGYVEC